MTLGGAAEIVIFSGLIEEIRYHDWIVVILFKETRSAWRKMAR